MPPPCVEEESPCPPPCVEGESPYPPPVWRGSLRGPNLGGDTPTPGSFQPLLPQAGGPRLTCRWVMLRSMFMVDVSQFSEMYL